METRNTKVIHTEEDVIKRLYDLGLIEDTEERGVWFTAEASEILDEQVSLRYIEKSVEGMCKYISLKVESCMDRILYHRAFENL